MAGTFIIRPLTLDSGGTPLTDVGSIVGDSAGWYSQSPATVLESLQALSYSPDILTAYAWVSFSPPQNFNNIIRVGAVGASIYLDGSLVPIDINGLPSGFTPTSAAVFLGVQFHLDNGVPGEKANFYYQQGIGIESPVVTVNDSIPIGGFPYNFNPTPPTMLDIVNDGFGLRVDLTAIQSTFVNPGCIIGIYNLRVEGTYTIQSFQFTLKQPTNPVEQNTPISVISSGESNSLNPTQIQSVTIEFLDENGDPQTIDIPPELWITITFTLFTFLLPSFGAFTPGIISISITSTQFSGSVTLGKLITIYFENAPGIYRIVPGKTNDTLYDITNGGTIDVKIPNPVFKTGYIGG